MEPRASKLCRLHWLLTYELGLFESPRAVEIFFYVLCAPLEIVIMDRGK